MSLPDQSSQTDCQGGGSEFELRIPILVNLFKVGLPTSTHSVGRWQATRAPHVIEFTCGDRVAIREGTNKSPHQVPDPAAARFLGEFLLQPQGLARICEADLLRIRKSNYGGFKRCRSE